MKHKATVDLEFTNGDIFEQEIIKAMRAYAKTIAREAFQKEIQDEVINTAKTWTKRLYESRYVSPITDKIVEKVTRSYIEEQMSHKDMLDLIGVTISCKIKECQDEVNKYICSEVEKHLNSSFITNTIQKEIEKAIPQVVLDVLMKIDK